ncbi:hypothetical protein LMG27174_05372 [Paraburkholderia rhynchosiae]|uniref:Uncharacterized protein n=1 Tax=Paraburkholderia rhynchosiae TaxID=487049 RepID=A0A2N7VU37_9BURK|nr:hypothetical protein C0Z16_34415 [Paraburkholderia rhynchosiae]CAB3726027.1 hypothetical protein LMG27174_05372 [Paraburkholderia rhynchosiae]
MVTLLQERNPANSNTADFEMASGDPGYQVNPQIQYGSSSVTNTLCKRASFQEKGKGKGFSLRAGAIGSVILALARDVSAFDAQPVDSGR